MKIDGTTFFSLKLFHLIASGPQKYKHKIGYKYFTFQHPGRPDSYVPRHVLILLKYAYSPDRKQFVNYWRVKSELYNKEKYGQVVTGDVL